MTDQLDHRDHDPSLHRTVPLDDGAICYRPSDTHYHVERSGPTGYEFDGGHDVVLVVSPGLLGMTISLRRVVDGKTEATSFDDVAEAEAFAAEYEHRIVERIGVES